MAQAVPTYEELFSACRHSAVHLEMRDGYMTDDPLFIAWRAGHRDDPDDRASWWRAWHSLVASAVAREIVVRRARVVSEPVSEYIRFEYDITFTNVTAGEQVRWLPRRLATDVPLPGNDFWLFDDRLALVTYFSGDGDVVDRELTTETAVIRLCRSAFEAVWQRATPHEDYRPF